jgi:hypothetical protein
MSNRHTSRVSTAHAYLLGVTGQAMRDFMDLNPALAHNISKFVPRENGPLDCQPAYTHQNGTEIYVIVVAVNRLDPDRRKIKLEELFTWD